jgi:hypothetical protein
MLTGELRNKVDSLWEIFWTGGLANPLDVIEQMTYLMFIHDLDANDNLRAKEAAEAVLEKIDLLKKSILARAFRGELGTNDPTEESALELLKSVLQQPI